MEENYTKLYEECKKYPADYVYKRIREYIIVMRKPLDFFKCNEMRKDVKNKYFAKMRANYLFVVAIIHCQTLTYIQSIMHQFNEYPSLVYRVNQCVIPDNYDADIDCVCTFGIHYFLSLEAAYYLQFFQKKWQTYDMAIKWNSYRN